MESAGQALLAGIDALPQVGCPGCVAVFGDSATPCLTTTNKPKALLAVAVDNTNGGRVVACGHEGYFGGHLLPKKGAGSADLTPEQRLFRNAVLWATAAQVDGGDDGEGLTVGILGKDAQWLGQVLQAVGLSKAQAVLWSASDECPPCHVLLWRGSRGSGDVCHGERCSELCEPIAAHVASGRSLLTSMCPWGFEQVTHERLEVGCAQNHCLRRFGMAFTGQMCNQPTFSLATSSPQLAHLGPALHALTDATAQGKTCFDADHVEPLHQAVHLLPLIRTVPVGQRLLQAIDRVAMKDPFVSGKPVEKNDVQSLAMIVHSDRWHCAEIDAVEPLVCPSDKMCFGDTLGSAATCAKHFAPDPAARNHGWQCTGVYALPGCPIEVTVESEHPEWWKVRIGCHSDRLWHCDQWHRWPEVTVCKDCKGNTLRAACPFGGLVFVQSDNKNRSCSAKFDICGGVEAPLFRAGFTDPAAWHAIRMAPAPWAELAGDVICINLPSKAIRELDDPLSVVSYWDEVVKCHAQLAGVPLPSRPERLVVDVQISAGYMHAGYPIMMHMDQLGNNHASDSPGLLDVATLRRKGNWGVFHEIGHNFQQPTWTFEGTGEVTVNWFSLHAMDKIVGIEPWKHPWLKNQKPNAAKYIKEGANFSKWQRDAGLALVTYALVQKMVGWGAFADTTRDYQTLSKEEEPKTLSEKIATFVCIMSKACELDLRAYFKTWGWPLDQDHPSLPELAALPSPPWAAKDAILYEIEHEN
eukprot:m.192734 g.192734  ORF g.192734 m.192734 type:complete len:752 (+) comp18274_c0_seq2:162-2417(+)